LAARISVIIPVFNGGAAFGRCLTALWESDYANWECIVVDDGSVDSSAERAEQFGATVVRCERPQSGPAVARNLGANSAEGDVLFSLTQMFWSNQIH
jgi:glycosyltransferase involved in cell wall biosynthesis